MVYVEIRRRKLQRLKKDRQNYTGPAAYGSVKDLQKASKFPEKTVQKILTNAYTKYKTYRKNFPD